MIAGLEPITSGDFLINQECMNDARPRDRDIAMVFQSYALYPHMDVARNMGFSMEIRKAPAEERKSKVEQAAQTLGLYALTDRLPKALSGGQRQRVAMGRAIIRDPHAFLFDEPLSNLDAALRVEMRLKIARLHQNLGATMIYVTHDQVEALTLADRIVVLNDGYIQQVGSPLELYERPANKFVAQFIGSPTMNLLPVTGTEVTLQMARHLRCLIFQVRRRRSSLASVQNISMSLILARATFQRWQMWSSILALTQISMRMSKDLVRSWCVNTGTSRPVRGISWVCGCKPNMPISLPQTGWRFGLQADRTNSRKGYIIKE